MGLLKINCQFLLENICICPCLRIELAIIGGFFFNICSFYCFCVKGLIVFLFFIFLVFVYFVGESDQVRYSGPPFLFSKMIYAFYLCLLGIFEVSQICVLIFFIHLGQYFFRCFFCLIFSLPSFLGLQLHVFFSFSLCLFYTLVMSLLFFLFVLQSGYCLLTFLPVPKALLLCLVKLVNICTEILDMQVFYFLVIRFSLIHFLYAYFFVIVFLFLSVFKNMYHGCFLIDNSNVCVTCRFVLIVFCFSIHQVSVSGRLVSFF